MTSLDQIALSHKRKRTDEDEFDADAALARSLQAEEYEHVESKPSKGKRPARRIVEDSDESMLSEPPTAESSDDQGPLIKKTKSNRSTILPNRRARNAARDSLTADARLLIEDSEEDSESEFSLPDSEDDEPPDEDIASTASASPAPEATNVTATTSSARRRRRRGTRSARTNAGRQAFNERRIAGLNDRVSLKGKLYVKSTENLQAAKERAKLERAHPGIKTMWDDLKAVTTLIPAQAKQPETITRKLKSFQLEGLDWMTRQERSQWKGGLLGDEMGMGKTIQAVSLIMSDYPAKDPSLVVVVGHYICGSERSLTLPSLQ